MSEEVKNHVLSVIQYPDPRLRYDCDPIIEKDLESVKPIIKCMIDTMYESNGVGLAAPQIGLGLQIFVMDWKQLTGKKNPVIVINPFIVYFDYDGFQTIEKEGCLSLPGISADLKRYNHVHLAFLDENLKAEELDLERLPAAIIQHELDHLDGKLFIDRLSRLRRKMLLNKIIKNTRLLKKMVKNANSNKS